MGICSPHRFGLSIALFTYLGTKNASNSLIGQKPQALNIRCYDKDNKTLYNDYYILNSTNNLLQKHFIIAYVGKDSQGAKPLKVVTVKKAKKLYRQSKHYSFYAQKVT